MAGTGCDVMHTKSQPPDSPNIELRSAKLQIFPTLYRGKDIITDKLDDFVAFVTWIVFPGDFRQVEQPVADVFVLKRDAAEVFSAIDVPRSDRNADVERPRVVGVALYHQTHHVDRH